MLEIKKLSYAYPTHELYDDISFTLKKGQHCAFIGASGSGKSTLIDIILHPTQYMFEGSITQEEQIKIGYIQQVCQSEVGDDCTVFQYIAKSFHDIQQKIDVVCEQMSTGENLEILMQEYQELLDQFDAMNGHNFENEILKQLNLAQLISHKDLAITQVSGGEFKLIQIIKEMLLIPDLMIMDEPDVFLDFEHINALKNMMNEYKGTLLVVTHNRYLLNHCFNKIIHLENMKLQEFNGNYVDYRLALLEQKVELQELAYEDSLEIERNAILINRLRERATDIAEAAHGKSLNARVKIQERLEARRIAEPFVHIKQPEIVLATENPVQDIDAIKVCNYSVAFEDILLTDVNFVIKSNEKVALLGANGTGKTTLMKDIFYNNHPAITISEEMNIAYLSQIEQQGLHEDYTMMEEFFDLGFSTREEITEYLIRYDFKKPEQKISQLSGGEKNILKLAKISAQNVNMLLLDEPTNHLDTYAQIALEEAIKKYNGGIVMISHDFYTIANCMDYALIIDDKTIRKISMRKFRKMIYAKYLDKDYLQIEQERKKLELQIEQCLLKKEFEKAKLLCEKLKSQINFAQ